MAAGGLPTHDGPSVEGGNVIRSSEELGAYALDAQGKVLLASPVAESLSGWDFSDLRHHHYLEYVPPELASQVKENFERAMNGERIEGAVQIVTADGSQVGIGFTVQPDKDAGETVIGVSGTVWLD